MVKLIIKKAQKEKVIPKKEGILAAHGSNANYFKIEATNVDQNQVHYVAFDLAGKSDEEVIKNAEVGEEITIQVEDYRFAKRIAGEGQSVIYALLLEEDFQAHETTMEEAEAREAERRERENERKERENIVAALAMPQDTNGQINAKLAALRDIANNYPQGTPSQQAIWNRDNNANLVEKKIFVIDFTTAAKRTAGVGTADIITESEALGYYKKSPNGAYTATSSAGVAARQGGWGANEIQITDNEAYQVFMNGAWHDFDWTQPTNTKDFWVVNNLSASSSSESGQKDIPTPPPPPPPPGKVPVAPPPPQPGGSKIPTAPPPPKSNVSTPPLPSEKAKGKSVGTSSSNSNNQNNQSSSQSGETTTTPPPISFSADDLKARGEEMKRKKNAAKLTAIQFINDYWTRNADDAGLIKGQTKKQILGSDWENGIREKFSLNEINAEREHLKDSIDQQPINLTPWLIGGGVILVGGLLFAWLIASKRKKRKKFN